MKHSALLLPLCALLTLGCSSSVDVSPSGFLTNYSQLGPDLNRFDTAAVYLSPTTDFKSYKSIMIDPTQISWPGSGMSDREIQGLAAYFDRALHRELGKDYRVVLTAAPDTMRLRSSLGGSANQVSGGLTAFVTTTKIEAEVIDSQSGARLVAISDKTLEDLNPSDTLTSVNEVKLLLDTAAIRLRNGLTDLRARILTTN